MADDPIHSAEPDAAAPSHNGDGDQQMRLLRDLLIGPERERLDALAERLDDPDRLAQDVSRVIAEAALIRTHADTKLDQALEPIVEKSLRVSVKKNPRQIADVIFPIMGPAIRKAISDTFARMLGSLSQALEHSFSLHSIRWRFEAWRSGKSFAEVVLLHTLLYRVEQVYLIHRDTGLLLQHVAGPSVDVRDGDMVSGMLTAIRDFVGDSFELGEGEALDTLRVGELTVWIEAGPHAVLAAVIRGNPPHALRDELQVTLEHIHAEYAEELTEYEGDSAPFERCRPMLESCLEEAKRDDSRRRPWLGWAAVATVIVLLGLWIGVGIRNEYRWRQFIQGLRSQPGVVITGIDRRAGRDVIYGLRDPLAPDEATLLASYTGDRSQVDLQFKPYYDTAKSFVERRVMDRLQPPSTVNVTLEADQLTLTGTAPTQWIKHARQVAPAIAGVGHVDDTKLMANDAEKLAMDRLRKALHPPDTVRLALVGDVLVATGTASEAWIDKARWGVRLIDDTVKLDTSRLAVEDRSHAIFRQVNMTLEPPGSVVLSLVDGVLTARGSASTRWINDARLLARTISGIDTYDDDQLVANDREQVILQRAGDLLRPPASVKLSVQGDQLTATGDAPQGWIDRARVLASAVDGVKRFNDDKLISSDGQKLLWSRIESTLRPPESVKLTLDGDTLKAAGSATTQWIESARLLVRVLPEVKTYDDHALQNTDLDRDRLVKANVLLRPPSTVLLSLDGDTLTASGSAPAAWVKQSRNLATLVDGVTRFDDSAILADAQRRLAAAEKRTGQCRLNFNRTTIDLLEDQNTTLDSLLTDLRTLIDAGELVGRRLGVKVVGHTDNVSPEDENLILSASRADHMARMLVLAGVPADRIQHVGVGSAGQPNRRMSEAEKAQYRCVTFDVIEVPNASSP
ncbi:OmpA family protein [Planctomycetales bacterium ZRK34]|nr:OmpA family protein [Planctomycetales bacterium ZRK34]